MHPALRNAAALICLGLSGAFIRAGSAEAFELFGFFGDDTPKPSQEALPYVLDVDSKEDSDVVDIVRDSAALQRLKTDAPRDGESLVRRARADLPRIYDGLWAEGYHDAKIEMLVGGQKISAEGGPDGAAVRAAEALRGRARVPILVRVTPGKRFKLREIRFRDPKGQPIATGPEHVLKLEKGAPARAADMRAAQARVIEYYRQQSRPLTKAGDISVNIDHPSDMVDATIRVEPGVVAPIGDIAVAAPPGIPESVIRSFIYAEPTETYSPEKIAGIRKSIMRIQAVSAARVIEGEQLDAQGRLPLKVEVGERPLHLIGAGVRYSTLDGPSARAYWEHRNLLGGAEYLRLETDLFAPPRPSGQALNMFKNFKPTDLGGRFKATFIKPALWGSRNDFVSSALIERDRTGGGGQGGYTSNKAELFAGVRHRFSDTFSVQGGLSFEHGRTSDALGDLNYSLIGAPLSLTYDSTDNPLDPKKGVKIQLRGTPYFAMGGAKNFFEARGSIAAYHAFDEAGRYVLAGRLGLGSVIGADLAHLPANHRMYAGGGASVRGFRNQSLAPEFGGQVVGGRSLIEASLEARIKVTDTIGVVPFFDAGGAFTRSYPSFSDPIRYSAGLGLRYYTGIGPIRLDVAVPINKRPGDRPVAVYIGIGQAF